MEGVDPIKAGEDRKGAATRNPKAKDKQRNSLCVAQLKGISFLLLLLLRRKAI